MTREELLTRITIDPNVCFGKPCIRGHRIWVSLILDLLAGGMNTKEILESYPGIDEDDIRACSVRCGNAARALRGNPTHQDFLKIELDENLGHRIEQLFEEAGHEVSTVHEESLCSASDDEVIVAARKEDRCLVTLDFEFSNPLRYRAADYKGIAVLRLPAEPSIGHLEQAARTLIAELEPSIVRHLRALGWRTPSYSKPKTKPVLAFARRLDPPVRSARSLGEVTERLLSLLFWPRFAARGVSQWLRHLRARPGSRREKSPRSNPGALVFAPVRCARSLPEGRMPRCGSERERGNRFAVERAHREPRAGAPAGAGSERTGSDGRRRLAWRERARSEGSDARSRPSRRAERRWRSQTPEQAPATARQLRHSGECQALDPDELETFGRLALDFEAQLSRLADTLHQLIERLRLRVAALEFRDRGDVEAVPILLDDDVEFLLHRAIPFGILRPFRGSPIQPDVLVPTPVRDARSLREATQGPWCLLRFAVRVVSRSNRASRLALRKRARSEGPGPRRGRYAEPRTGAPEGRRPGAERDRRDNG